MAGRHRVRLASDMTILAKATATLEDIVQRRLSPQRILGTLASDAAGMGSILRALPGQVDQLLHDFQTGGIMVRAVTPQLDEVPQRLQALGGRLSLAAFAAATTIATAIVVPETTASAPRLVAGAGLALAAAISWTVLFAWHWFGTGKPVRVTPFLRLFRR